MKIVDLPGGRVSLEFATVERETVLADLQSRCGAVRREGAYELVSERGERFVYMDEWDEPCLMSVAPAGDLLLRQIAGDRLQTGTA